MEWINCVDKAPEESIYIYSKCEDKVMKGTVVFSSEESVLMVDNENKWHYVIEWHPCYSDDTINPRSPLSEEIDYGLSDFKNNRIQKSISTQTEPFQKSISTQTEPFIISTDPNFITAKNALILLGMLYKIVYNVNAIYQMPDRNLPRGWTYLDYLNFMENSAGIVTSLSNILSIPYQNQNNDPRLSKNIKH